jgi:hypothetical protein
MPASWPIRARPRVPGFDSGSAGNALFFAKDREPHPEAASRIRSLPTATTLTPVSAARYPPSQGDWLSGPLQGSCQPPTSANIVFRVAAVRQLVTLSCAVMLIATVLGNVSAQTVQLPPPAASSLDRIAQASPYGYPLSPPPPAWDAYGPQASQIYPVPATSAISGQPGYPGSATAAGPIGPNMGTAGTYPPGYPQPPSQQSEWFQNTYQQTLRIYQGARGSWTYIMGNGQGTRVGVNELDTSATFALPFFMHSPANLNHAPLLITPGFGLQLWDGPQQTSIIGADLPPNTYDVFVDTAWNPQFTPLFGAELGIRVGIFTNWDVLVADSWRIMGRAIGTLRMTPTWQAKAGIIYLDRNQVKLLPAAGFVWTPNADSRYDIFFPAPRAMKRFGNTRRHSWWGYVAGEYGGGAWTFRRDTGMITGFDYNDIRVSLGTEWTPLATTGLAGNFEVGYVFYRQLYYTAGPPGFQQITDLPSTIMFRLGLAY